MQRKSANGSVLVSKLHKRGAGRWKLQYSQLFSGMNYIQELGKSRALWTMISTSLLVIGLAAFAAAQESSGERSAEDCHMPPLFQNLMIPVSKLHEMKTEMMEEMHSCLHLNPPKEMLNMMKNCTIKAMKSPELREHFNSEDKSVKDMIQFAGDSIEQCHMSEYGFDMTGNDLNLQDLVDKIEMDEWVGTMKDLKVQKRIVMNCSNTVQGETSQERLHAFRLCTHFGTIDYCEEEDEDIGMLPAVLSLFLTVDDEPMCDSVEFREEIIADLIQCTKDAAEGIDVSAAAEAEISPMMKTYVLFQELLKKVCMPALECMIENWPVPLLNKGSWKIDMQPTIEYVKRMRGWDNIIAKRDELTSAMSECSDVFDEEAPQQETKIELYKRITMQFIEFDRCILPKFANTCGINSKLSEFFFPLLNKEFLKTSVAVFFQSGGSAASDVITMMEKMGSPYM